MNKRRQAFLTHLLIFLLGHLGFFVLLQADFKMTGIVQTYMTWIQEGKIGYYDLHTGIHVNTVWLIILIADGVHAYYGKEHA